MPVKRVFTPEEIELFKKMVLDETITIEEVEKEFNISESKVHTTCRDHSIKGIWSHVYTCCVCGKEFRATHNSAICPECKATPSVCVICGKEFPKTTPYTQKTCSAKCRGKYRAESGIAKEGAQKMLASKIERYGTVDPAEVTKLKKGGELEPKECPLCHKMFVPNTPRQVYCTDKHYGPCPVCGKMTEIKENYTGPQACSEACRVARIQGTSLERYGNKAAVNSDHARILAKQHTQERYGVDYYSQTDEYKARFKETMQERYGVDSPMQSPIIQERAKQTNLERYGVEYAAQSEEFRARSAQTNLEKYGGTGLASPVLRERIIATNREKYGVDFPIQTPEVQAKVSATLREKYGVDNFWKSMESLEDRIKDPSKVQKYYEFKQDPRAYIESHFDRKPTAFELAEDLGVTDTPVYDVLLRADSSDAIAATKRSTMEWQVLDFLKSIVPDAKIDINIRRVIAPSELDFYLPEYNLGIECNPTETHQSSIQGPFGSDPLPISYHYNKTIACEEKGIFLFHIFGYEWEHKREIIKSMLRNILGCNTEKYYARKTEVVELTSLECKKFLNDNHRQGACNSPIRLGLVDKNTKTLLSVMTFGKMRPAIGQLKGDENTAELVRFCNKINTSVTGGASKLFQYFLNNWSPEKIVSFSDRAHTKGNLYATLGFQEVSKGQPGYVWVKKYYNTTRNRVACQKHNLVKMFKDVTEETIQEKSERQIMIEHGYVQVFDSGVIRWEYVVK